MRFKINGEDVLFDDSDLPIFNRRKWKIQKHGITKRVVDFERDEKTRKTKTLFFHREILNPKNGFEVDHKNGNPLDNRRENLRICNRQQNSFNLPKLKTHGKNPSPYKGVSYSGSRNRRKPWRASLRMKENGVLVSKFYKHYESQFEAAIAYNMAAIKYFGEFARLNNVCPDFT